jgi:hypothetical protein
VGVLKQNGVDRVFTLGSRCLLGRSPACDLRIDNPRVSGEHASVYWASDHWELRDLGSRNGTLVDGIRIGVHERQPLAPGSTFQIGHETFCLEEGSPPVASARHGTTGLLRTATHGLLVLPDDERPEVSIFEDASGRWVADDGDGAIGVTDRQLLVVDGEGWRLDLPSLTTQTWPLNVFVPTSLALRFGVSRNEEHVEVTVLHEGRVTPLPPRSHHYLLLTLARALMGDPDPSDGERGWVDREQLCRMLATDARKLNVDVFRVRRQLAALGIQGSAGIIARRPGTGQLRLGTDRVEVTKL